MISIIEFQFKKNNRVIFLVKNTILVVTFSLYINSCYLPKVQIFRTYPNECWSNNQNSLCR